VEGNFGLTETAFDGSKRSLKKLIGCKIRWNAIYVGLSRRQHRFKSGWGRQNIQKGLDQVAKPFSISGEDIPPIQAGQQSRRRRDWGRQ